MVPIFGGVIVVSYNKNHIFFSKKIVQTVSCNKITKFPQENSEKLFGLVSYPPIFFWIKKASRFQKTDSTYRALSWERKPPTTNWECFSGWGDFSTYDKSIQKKVRHIVYIYVYMMYDEYFYFILVPVPTVFEFQLQKFRSSMYIYIYA